ncbi:MAG: hypothetical protein DI535_16415 [Citrobacter freundii]|nr:MAG: hypothetical protein DI535_16415 [Citrobacter freundii]
MDNSRRIFLLKVIKFSGDISPLIKGGLEYYQVVDMIGAEVAEGNAETINGELILTQKGNDLLEQLVKQDKRKGSDAWIEPEEESRIPKIEKNEIFLPSQNDLSF